MLLALQKLSSNLGQFKPTPGPDQLGRRALTLSQNQDRANVKGPEIFFDGGGGVPVAVLPTSQTTLRFTGRDVVLCNSEDFRGVWSHVMRAASRKASWEPPPRLLRLLRQQDDPADAALQGIH